MFYSQEILQKRGGKFGKIWLAATRMSKLTRREIASVCVSKSCDDVLAYVEKRVAPSKPGEKRPRFSLYLSAQLMFGLVRIFEKQSFYLVTDASSVFCRVKMIPVHDIDLAEPLSKELVTQPEIDIDAAMVIETTQDTFRESANGNGTLKEQLWGLSSASERSSSIASKRSDSKTRDADPEREVPQASIEQITLVEPPSVLVNTALSPILIPRELDLPPINMQELDLLLENVPEPRLSVSDLLPPGPQDQPGEDKQTKSTTERVTEEPKEKTPTRKTTSEEAPSTRPAPLSPGVTQQILTSPLIRRPTRPSFQLELTPITPSPSRKRQRRQLVFADKETQIPKTEMRKNLMSSSDITRDLGLVDPLSELPEALLKRPSTKRFRPDVSTGLWAKAAIFRAGIPEEQLPSIESPDVSMEERQRAQDMTTERVEHRETSLLDLQQEPNILIPDIQQPDIQPLDIQPPEISINIIEPPAPVQQSTPFVTPVEGPKRKRRKRTLEESMEKLREAGAASDLHGSSIETPSIEQPRDASTSGLNVSVNLEDTLILDNSRKSKSASKRPRSSRSDRQADVNLTDIPEPGLVTSRSTLLYDLPEESMVSNQSLLENDPDFFLSILSEIEKSEGNRITTFGTICPPEHTDRKTAARNFTALLVLAATRKVQVRQKTPFAEIYITRLTE